MGYHGKGRATNDIGLWVRRTEENARPIALALRDSGFSVSELGANLFLDEHKIIRMGRPPRIAVATTLSGAESDACNEPRVVAHMHGLSSPIICPHRLPTNKREAGRPKDLRDADYLERHRRAMSKTGATIGKG